MPDEPKDPSLEIAKRDRELALPWKAFDMSREAG